MNRRNLLLLAATLALASCAHEELESSVDPRFAREVADVTLDPAAAVAELDAYRASRGLGPVRLDDRLTAMANEQAEAMAAKGELSHTAGGPFSARLAAARISVAEAGENVGAGYFALRDAMAGWRASPEHNANLLRQNFTRIGVAIAKNARSHWGVFWAMEFSGEPQTALQ